MVKDTKTVRKSNHFLQTFFQYFTEIFYPYIRRIETRHRDKLLPAILHECITQCTTNLKYCLEAVHSKRRRDDSDIFHSILRKPPDFSICEGLNPTLSKAALECCEALLWRDSKFRRQQSCLMMTLGEITPSVFISYSIRTTKFLTRLTFMSQMGMLNWDSMI